MLAILWTGTSRKSVPWEYIELTLCRDVYHCTPLELDKQPLDRVLMHLKLMNVEQRVRDFSKQKSTGGGKTTGRMGRKKE